MTSETISIAELVQAVAGLQREVEQLRAKGVKILQEPKKPPSGTRWIAFIEDPDGYKIELIQRH